VPDIDVVGAIAVALGVTVAEFLIAVRLSGVSGSQTLHWILGGGLLFVVYIASRFVWVAAAVHFARNLANSLALLAIPGVSPVSLRTPLSERSKTSITRSWSTGVVLISLAWYGIA
jgi:hypothetical protein